MSDTVAPTPFVDPLEADQREREREDAELRAIRRALRATGLGEPALAARLGVGNLTLGALLTGQQRCSRAERAEIAEAIEQIAADREQREDRP